MREKQLKQLKKYERVILENIIKIEKETLEKKLSLVYCPEYVEEIKKNGDYFNREEVNKKSFLDFDNFDYFVSNYMRKFEYPDLDLFYNALKNILNKMPA
ncbi:TPA: hypothetical protein J1A61_004780 [Escherichia coli]|nr:hypothetical protein [Escherichia coli]